MTPAFDFDADTAIEASGDGRFRASVPAHWSVGPGPNGGFLAAVAARALEASFAPPLRTLSLFYLAPPALGPLELAVTPLREGRTTAFARVELTQDGTAVVTGLAALSPAREDTPAYADVPAPDYPDPDDCIVVEHGRPGQPDFLGNYDMRVVRPDAAARPVVLGGYIRPATPRPLSAPLLAAMSDAWIPPAVVRIAEPVFCPTIDLTIHFRAPLPVAGDGGWVRTRFTSQAAAGGTTDEDGVLWGEDGTLLAQVRQLAVVRSVPAR